jgi:adenosylcobinamide-GDP ribazoletransferase
MMAVPSLVQDWLDDLRIATALLTRVPMPHPDGAVPENLTRAQRAFPLVGAAIGAVVGCVYVALTSIGVPALAAAALALAASAALTGALHEDGLGDVGDGFGGGHDRDSKLAIMRDSRLGTYGTLMVVIAFVTKAAALQALAAGPVIAALIVAHALGRAVITVLASTMLAARKDGLGQAAGQPDGTTATTAVIVAAAVAIVCLPLAQAMIAIGLATAGGMAMAWLAWRQIGGATGDVYGAAEQVVEIAVLVFVAAKAV